MGNSNEAVDVRQLLMCCFSARPDQGGCQRRAGHFGTQQGRYHGERLHAADRGGREADARCDLLGADNAGAGGRLVKLASDLVRFGTVGVG